MDEGDRKNLASNIVGHASDRDVEQDMKTRVVEYWTNVDKDLGAAVKDGLGV
jgi:catalase